MTLFLNKPAVRRNLLQPHSQVKGQVNEGSPQVSFTYFLLKSTVEDENEQSLESIKGGEEICHHNSLLINKKKPKGPGEAQETQQGKRAKHPRPEKIKWISFLTGSMRGATFISFSNDSVVEVDLLYVHSNSTAFWL